MTGKRRNVKPPLRPRSRGVRSERRSERVQVVRDRTGGEQTTRGAREFAPGGFERTLGAPHQRTVVQLNRRAGEEAPQGLVQEVTGRGGHGSQQAYGVLVAPFGEQQQGAHPWLVGAPV